MKKKLTVVAALVLVLAMGVGGTLAYLTDTSDTITNTFTIGNVKISLVENEYDSANPAQPKKADGKLVPVSTKNGAAGQTYKMIPGTVYYKDPTVTVQKGSEACWLFVKVVKSTNFDNYIDNGMASGWTELDATNHPGVYYREVGANATDDQSFSVIGYRPAGENTSFANNQVMIKSSVTEEDIAVLNNTSPTMTITAYAIQQANIDTAAAAWAELNPSTTPTP